MNIQITLALRYLSGRKLRTFLTTLAVVFGVLVLFGMNIILPSMLESLQVNALAAAGQVDVTITHSSGEAFAATTVDQVKGLDGVRAVSTSLNRTVNLPPNFFDKDPKIADKITALALVGVDPEAARSVRSYPIVNGRYLQAGDQADAIISQTLADGIGVKVGDSFSIPTVNGVTVLNVAGILPPRAVPGNEEVLVTLQQTQKMTDQPGKINAIDTT